MIKKNSFLGAAQPPMIKREDPFMEQINSKINNKGICLYNHTDLHRIAGKHSADIENILGHNQSDVVIHRDDMVILSTSTSLSTMNPSVSILTIDSSKMDETNLDIHLHIPVIVKPVAISP